MDALVYFVAGILINGFVGALVWALLDDDNESLFEWYRQAPSQILKILVLEFWPVVIWIRICDVIRRHK